MLRPHGALPQALTIFIHNVHQGIFYNDLGGPDACRAQSIFKTYFGGPETAFESKLLPS